MTHFSVLIIGDEPEKQLAPYYQYNDFENCEKSQFMPKWDYCGPGPKTFFELKNNKSSHSAIKSNIAFEKMFNIIKDKSHKEYEHYHSIAIEYGQPQSLSEIQHSLSLDSTLDLKDARRIYKEQKTIKIFQSLDDYPYEIMCLVKKYSVNKEDFADHQAFKFLFSHEAVVVHGKWHERLLGGLHKHSENVTEHEWLKSIWDLISGSTNETLISVYECHS